MADLFTVLTPREAWSRLEPHLHPIDRVETVATAEALGRVLAEDMSAPVDLPHFARSAMDGYAVRAVETAAASDVDETVSTTKKPYYVPSEAEADESELFGHREPQ